MHNRHRRALERIFASPTPADLKWNEVVSLLTYLGASIEASRGGSHRRVRLHGRKLHTSEPHGANPLARSTVGAVREFLRTLGVEP